MRKIFYLLVVVVVALMACGFFYYTHSQKTARLFWVAFLNIGQGDSSLVHFENGEKLLVDCGPDRTVLSELGNQLPFWDRTIDTLIVTHPDRDHYAGCIDVLERYTVKKIVTNGQGKPYDAEWEEFDNLVASEDAEVVTMASPTMWSIAGSRLEFLSPNPNLNLVVGSSDSNNYSIVFRLIHDNKKILFTGDMEFPLEEALMEKYCGNSAPCAALQADVLKVGHHGSPGSSGENFLKAIDPKTAVISVGKNNRFGHPSSRVLRRLERVGASVWRTDTMGRLIF